MAGDTPIVAAAICRFASSGREILDSRESPGGAGDLYSVTITLWCNMVVRNRQMM